jgi:hypothetical protein
MEGVSVESILRYGKCQNVPAKLLVHLILVRKSQSHQTSSVFNTACTEELSECSIWPKDERDHNLILQNSSSQTMKWSSTTTTTPNTNVTTTAATATTTTTTTTTNNNNYNSSSYFYEDRFPSSVKIVSVKFVT